MRYAIVLTAAGSLILAVAPVDRPRAQTNSQGVEQATTAPLRLSEQDKAAVISAAVEAKSHQKTPKEFTPAVGASVPREVYSHSFTPEVAREMPILNQYEYAYLDREIVLIDGMQKKVVAVIPLPAHLVSGGQKDQGAAEPASESKSKGASTTGSVPAYTSPETVK
jgi:hypothetical protein